MAPQERAVRALLAEMVQDWYKIGISGEAGKKPLLLYFSNPMKNTMKRGERGKEKRARKESKKTR